MWHISHIFQPLGDFTRVQAQNQKFVENLTFFIIFEHVFVTITVLCMVSVGKQQYFYFITTSIAVSATGNLRTRDICMIQLSGSKVSKKSKKRQI